MPYELQEQPQCRVFVQVPLVFCPKYRRAVLMPPIDGRLKGIIEELCGHGIRVD